MSEPRTTPSRAGSDLAAALDRWEREGLVSAEQAAALRADVAAHAPAPAAGPATSESLLTEALSYLGGVLVLVAGGLLTARFWDDLPFASRLLLAAAATAVLLGAGLVVPDRLGAAGRRVRSVLWVLAVAALAATLAVLAVDGWDLEGESVGMLVAGGAGLLAAVLWRRTRASLQLLALGVTAAVFAATTAVQVLGDHRGAVPGLAVLAVAALGGLGAVRGRLDPTPTAYVASSAGAVVGAAITTGGDTGWSYLLCVAVVVVVVVAAVRLDDLLVLGVGAVGALVLMPQAVNHFFPGLVAAALVLLAVGAGLIASGIVIANRRADRTRP